MLEHPDITQIERTGYPEPQPRLIDYSSKVVYREDPLERIRKRRKAREKQKEPSAQGF